jgi:hypothetical protein
MLKNPESLENPARKMRESTDQLGLDVIRTYFEYLDEDIKGNAERKKDWKVEKKGEKNGVLTEMGMLYYERRYYASKRGEGYCFLLDKTMGITSHQRIDVGFKDKLIKAATETSYEKATLSVGREKVSRQTVKRAIHALDSELIKHVVIPDKPDDKKTLKRLYIDADEDHITVLDKKRAEQKLVYVYEGKKYNAKEGKMELVNPYYITGVSGAEQFEEAYEYIRNNYDFTGIRKIYIQGDGANWIKAGTNTIPCSRYVLDKYHMMQQVRKCVGTDEGMRDRLCKALMSADMDELDVVMNEVLEGTDDEKKADMIRNFKYFYERFDGIEVHADPDECLVGCSAEGHVSHLLSSRLSSRPLRWSERGADNIAKLRACIKNGGNVSDVRKNQAYINEIEERKTIRKRYMTDGCGVMYDVYGNIEVLKTGHRTRLYKVLRKLRGA